MKTQNTELVTIANALDQVATWLDESIKLQPSAIAEAARETVEQIYDEIHNTTDGRLPVYDPHFQNAGDDEAYLGVAKILANLTPFLDETFGDRLEPHIKALREIVE